MSELANQVAVVTGAGRGIGHAIALKLAASGADIVAVGRTAQFLEQTVEEARKLGRKAWAITADVADAASVEAAATQILKEPGRADILVNNAGVTRDGLLMRMSEADWDTVLDTNLKGPFLFLKAAGRFLMRSKAGRVINISSVSGVLGNAGQANYSASKGGLISLTKTAARELGSRGVCVNAVAPGFIATDMAAKVDPKVIEAVTASLPLKRVGEAKEIAGAVLFLASDLAGYITGQVLGVDGGMAM